MQIILNSTEKIVTLIHNGAEIPARIWEGKTASGIPCHAYITRIAAHETVNQTEFQHEFQEHRPPTADIAAIPLRLIL